MRESVEIMKEISHLYDMRIDVFLSREAEIVLKYYRIMKEVRESFMNVYSEQGPNIPFLSGKLQIGKYRAFFICPATANTVAKLAHGIADSLITNSAAQAMKVDVPVYVFPVDQRLGKVITKLPDGSDLAIRVREVDIRNVQILRDMQGVTVLGTVDDIKEIMKGMGDQ
jgi:archaeoflavoprotein AfpA